MEVSEKENSEPLCEIDFGQFVRNVEINCQKSLLNLRKRQLLKEKFKETRLIKSKILPPSFAKIGDQNIPKELPSINAVHLHSFYNQRKTAPTSECQGDFKDDRQMLSPINNREEDPRKQCKTSHSAYRSGNSCGRRKENWKLEYRMDELNILKYMRE